MPRGGGGGRRGGDASAEPEAIHELGVRGRKTGAFLKDTGERDEHGMQPLDAIFSSPGDALTNRDESGSEDMDISSSGGPGPQTVLKSRHSFQNATSSSPTRNPSAEKAAARRLDFSGKAGNKAAAKTNGKAKAAGVNGVSRRLEDSESEELDDVMGAGENGVAIDDVAEESILMVDSARLLPQKKRGKQAKEAPPAKPKAPKVATRAPVRLPSEESEPEQQEEEPEEEGSEQEEPEEVIPSTKQKGRAAKQDQKSSSQSSKKRGPPRKSPREDTPEETREPSEEEEEGEEEDVAPRKKQRTTGSTAAKAGSSKSKPSSKGKAPARGNIVVPVSTGAKSKAKAEPKTKGRPGRKPKNAGGDEDGDVGETSFAALQRGPPMPKSRGLVSLRKDLDDTMTQTRSGRHSYRPVQYWRGEQVVREDEEQADMFAKDRFVLPSIKEIVRVPEEEVRSRNTTSKGKARPKPKKPVVEEDYEEWEVNPGTVEGEVVIWETEHEEHPPADDEPVQVTDERIAISAKAVQTSEIRDATFRFAKTLTMPFMGAGVVDLPPGGEKRPKNSRKMHMVFFVHTGKVMVTINEAQFRISAGGMWFVPRGNYYSITNDYDNPSRVFFCQACEISPAQFEASQMSMGA
ncbi:Mif2/CENP-C like domain-containing protein [Trichoderma evansii]